MWVIDVNSGSRTGIGVKQEAIALQVNEAAMKEIARQMSLRGMGGIIIVDCISMKNPEHKRKIYQTIKEYLKESRTKVNILPLTRLGLMQITRERVRPAIGDLYSNGKKCMTCNGTGKAISSETIAYEIEHQIEVLLKKKIVVKDLHLLVHPLLYCYFSHGLFPKKWRWQFRYMKRIRLQADEDLEIPSYRLIYRDKQNQPVVIQP